MSWLKTAVNRAVEAGGNNNITRTVRNYADSVVYHAGNAVSEGAKIIQHRLGPRNLKSFRYTVKRLEEVSVSCRGTERVQLLRRWLVALKEIDRLSAAYPDDKIKNDNSNKNDRNSDDPHDSDDAKDSPKKPTVIYYFDPGMEGEPMNFRDVFLHSQALEGVTLSMILEPPNKEEVLLLLEIFRLCLIGEVHYAVTSSIQDLATAFSSYRDEVLVKREELLQYAQAAIAGLKINADLLRIDAEAHTLMEKLNKMKVLEHPSNEHDTKLSEGTTAPPIEDLQNPLEQIRICSKLEELILKKKTFSNGDSPELHSQKVDKLKVLSESLVSSTSKAEKCILDHRSQKEEALSFRVAKTHEISQLEKELAVEIGKLQKQKHELEAELKKVNTSLTAACARLRNAREEREQFDDASNQILVLLKSKEDELSRSVASCKTEANVVNRWINFLEDTWVLQTKYTEQKEKQVNGELERYADHFVRLVIHLLSAYKDQLASSIARIRKLMENLDLSKGSEMETNTHNENSKSMSPRKFLEEDYQAFEAKFKTTLSIVDEMKKHFYAQCKDTLRKDDKRVKELFDALDKLKEEFESIEGSVIEVRAAAQRSQSSEKLSDKPPQSPSYTPIQAAESLEQKQVEKKKRSFSFRKGRGGDAKAEMTKLESDSEDGEVISTEEIGEWEFDALDKYLETGG